MKTLTRNWRDHCRIGPWKHTETASKYFDGHGRLSQSKKRKCLWTHDKNGITREFMKGATRGLREGLTEGNYLRLLPGLSLEDRNYTWNCTSSKKRTSENHSNGTLQRHPLPQVRNCWQAAYQPTRDSTCYPYVSPNLTTCSFTSACGQVEVRPTVDWQDLALNGLWSLIIIYFSLGSLLDSSVCR